LHLYIYKDIIYKSFLFWKKKIRKKKLVKKMAINEEINLESDESRNSDVE
jgi:hypothetical protein